jgi:hypothetical protein
VGVDVRSLRAKYKAFAPALNERSRRLWAAAEAKALGWGGITWVVRATGISESTVLRGLAEIEAGDSVEPGRVRRPGGGRKKATEKDPRLLKALVRLVEPTVSGNPERPLRWTNKSLRKISEELKALGHALSYRRVADALRDAGYTLQSNRKAQEGRGHPDRDAQFRYINRCAVGFQRRRQPVISVDCKKKELVGNFKNAGRTWRPKGNPERVKVHDFIIKENGKAIPYGVYDPTRNEGWVSVGIDHETASFAVRTIRRWWQVMGRRSYPRATSLMITADAGGSNGPRRRLWRWELQRLSDATGLAITVCHFPPGTSKWNKIEHRLFSYISANWRGRPLTSLVTIVNLIASTRTKTGLRVHAEIDKGRYPTGIEVSEEKLSRVRIRRHSFHGDWNYTIRPRAKRRRR